MVMWSSSGFTLIQPPVSKFAQVSWKRAFVLLILRRRGYAVTQGIHNDNEIFVGVRQLTGADHFELDQVAAGADQAQKDSPAT